MRYLVSCSQCVTEITSQKIIEKLQLIIMTEGYDWYAQQKNISLQTNKQTATASSSSIHKVHRI